MIENVDNPGKYSFLYGKSINDWFEETGQIKYFFLDDIYHCVLIKCCIDDREALKVFKSLSGITKKACDMLNAVELDYSEFNSSKLLNSKNENIKKYFRIYQKIFSLLEKDNAFVIEDPYRPSDEVIQQIQVLLLEAVKELLYLCDFNEGARKGYLNTLDSKTQKENSRREYMKIAKEESKRKNSDAAKKGHARDRMFNHDMIKLALDRIEGNKKLSVNSLANDGAFIDKLVVIAEKIGCVAAKSNMPRRLKDMKTKYNAGELEINVYYYHREMPVTNKAVI